jgi:hypothetical protein
MSACGGRPEVTAGDQNGAFDPHETFLPVVIKHKKAPDDAPHALCIA